MRSIVEVVQNLIKPYIDSVKQALANEAVTRSKVGAHNLLPNDAVSSVFHGLTFTVNANGSISVSGQKDDASSHAYEICALFTLQAGTYTLSDGITDGTDNIDVAIYTSNGQTRLAWTRVTSHKETFTIASNTSCMAQINFRGATNTQFSYTVYPMLCLATDSNTEFEPYAMTNAKLTEQVNGIIVEQIESDSVSVAANGSSQITASLTKNGFIPLGIVSVIGLSSDMYIIEYGLTSTLAFATVKNTASSSQTGKMKFKVLYKKS